MASASQPGGGAILTLPWNRLPNYLIFVVAAANLITGAIALRTAAGFATGMSSFEDAVAATAIGSFGLILIWVAWCFRRGALPVRYIVDAEHRESGFRWGRWWNGRFDLSGTDPLIGELRRYRDRWLWAILVPSARAGEKDEWIYGSGPRYDTREEARLACDRVLQQVADHLAVAHELRTRDGDVRG